MDKAEGKTEDLWMASCDHFVNAMGKTAEQVFHWKHQNHEEALSQLSTFLAEPSLLVGDCQFELSTQLNESLTAMNEFARSIRANPIWHSYKRVSLLCLARQLRNT
jgi:predicted nicotinamide N-methyase